MDNVLYILFIRRYGQKETTSETVITTRFLDPVRTHNFMAGLRPLEFSVRLPVTTIYIGYGTCFPNG